MQSNFLVHSHITGRAITLTLSGELDLLSSPVLERAIERLPEIDADLIILDLRPLEFMDSTGLHLVVQAHQQAHDAGRRFALVRGGEQVQRLLGLTGMTDALTIVDTPEQLVEVDQAPGAP
jgi:anti-sigma B factor antagonist